ncbi:MAG TPA: hypothetical protein VFH27_13560, partial [Longimicrobiaceae bacterium]|nr:hypothetical protein [Longimicrobiaceae bacterium]
MRSRARKWTLAAAVFASAAGALPAPAQSAGPVPGAERVARRLFAALDSMRWRQAAALFHPAAQEGFRREQRERAVVMTRSDSAWQARSYGPDTPPAVAAWLAHRDSLSATRFQQTHLGQFAGVTRPAQLDSLPAAELLARWLEAHDERAGLRRTVSRMPPVL